MGNGENIRFISTVIVIFIILVLQYFYRTRYKANITGKRVNLTGVVIIIVSILLAIIWMWKR